MTVTPNSNRDRLSYPGKDRDSFLKHSERMREFRRAHPRVATREPEDVKSREWAYLVPVPPVNLHDYLQN